MTHNVHEQVRSHVCPLLLKWMPSQRQRPCDNVTWVPVQVRNQLPELRLNHVSAADVTPSAVGFSTPPLASNGAIRVPKISRAQPSIRELQPSKLEKVEVRFILRLLLPELICIQASLLWWWCGEKDQAGRKRKKKEIRKERGRKHGSNNERAVGLGMSFPPLLAAPVFNWYPQIHEEFRFTLLLFGGRAIADNKLCLWFLTGSHLSTIPSSPIALWGLQPVDQSFYICEHAAWLLMCLSWGDSSCIGPFNSYSFSVHSPRVADRFCLTYMVWRFN